MSKLAYPMSGTRASDTITRSSSDRARGRREAGPVNKSGTMVREAVRVQIGSETRVNWSSWKMCPGH